MRKIVEITQGVARHPLRRLARPVDFALSEGEQVAVYGPNGSGKSVFIDLLRGAIPLERGEVRYDFRTSSSARASDHIRYVAFRDVHGEAEPAYYQQRWNQWDETTCLTVAEALEAHRRNAPASAAPQEPEERDPDRWQEVLFGEDGSLYGKQIDRLSSGELRKFHIAKALAARPRLLLIDNPFIGLDAEARRMLADMLARLSRRISLMLVVSRPEDIPAFVTHVVPVERGTVMPKQAARTFRPAVRPEPAALTEAERERLARLAGNKDDAGNEEIIGFRDIRIRYGGRAILDHLDWTVRKGERWALQGKNGAGKSTLLSLVCADNPMAYACDISLFGRKRGQGESIWDIKRRIGYVSPEIYQTYRKDLPAIDIVASGLHDTVGLYRKPGEEEKARCREWLSLLRAEGLADRSYLRLSSGEQRLILLVRAFVKSPDLLVLDEPFHGLDTRNRSWARAVIDAYSRLPGKTLVMVSHYEEELPPCIDHHLLLTKHP